MSTPKSTRAGRPSTCALRGVVGTSHFLASSTGLNALQRPAVQQALRNDYFESLGLPRIYAPAQA